MQNAEIFGLLLLLFVLLHVASCWVRMCFWSEGELILIFGGVYQGMLDYAVERFGAAGDEIYRCSDDSIYEPEGKNVIYELDKWILALVREGLDTGAAVRRFADNNRDAVVISNDVSGGVVPEDPVMRKWREATGRALTLIAQESDEVVRLFCGIPTKLK